MAKTIERSNFARGTPGTLWNMLIINDFNLYHYQND